MTDPGWGPIGRHVFDRTYSRRKPDGTKEDFDEVVARMVDGNLALAPAGSALLEDERGRLVSLVSQLKLVPAGRHWWSSGVPGRQFLFNCHRAGWTDQLADHVGFTFDELMKGGGVGCNYSSDYLARVLPVARRVEVLVHVERRHPDTPEVRQACPSVSDIETTGLYDFDFATNAYRVPDSREGWVAALRFLCDLFQQEGRSTGVCFDVSEVRPRGSEIRGFGGTACGPGPLVEMLVAVGRVLNGCVGRRMGWLDAMTLDHEVARCVIAGNVRRSSRMSMLHWADDGVFDFIELKRGGGHWTTNMSVEVGADFWQACKAGDAHARRVLDRVAESALAYGEPGLYNSSAAAVGEERDVRCSNPCGEIPLEEWEQCNLGHLNLARLERDELDEALCLMTRWLVRATFGDGCSYRQRQVVDRNRRIGVGIMGFQEWLYKRFNLRYSTISAHDVVGEELQRMRDVVRLEADQYAKDLSIPVPIKCTTVAPTGTVAKMAGCTEGIHPVFSRYFVRRVRYAEDDPGLPALREAGLHVEPDLMSPRTVVVSFPCRDAALDVVPEKYLDQADELDIVNMLHALKTVQTRWADNAVSFTINVAPERYSANLVTQQLLKFGPFLKGVTLMPEGSYAQAPMERITRTDYEAMAGQTTASSAVECDGACPVR